MIASALTTNFNLFPGYSFHKSLYHKTLFLKPQRIFYPKFWNAKPKIQKHMFWSLFIFRGHTAREPASSRVTCFILRGLPVPVSARTNTGKARERLGKNAGEWTEGRGSSWTNNSVEGSALSPKPVSHSYSLTSFQSDGM